MNGQLLVVDDDRNMCELLESDLRGRGHGVQWRTTADEAMTLFRQHPFDLVLTDVKMPGTSGIELCAQLVADRADVPVIVMTGFGTMDTAIDAIRAGAYDFVTKPFELERLALVVDRALRHRELTEQVRVLSESTERSSGFDELVGESTVMLELFDQLDRIADSETSVLIVGESGTGKELVARALHRRSRRKGGSFVAINCTAIPENLMESTLFGHVKGAFTGATTDRDGIFRQADGGTLMLDEVGDLPTMLQPKLLRALEERVVRPVGGAGETGIDARLLCATHRDLESAVADGTFREDLYYRINVIQVDIPPLRARGNDVLLLAQRFVNQFAARGEKAVVGLSPPAAEHLLAYRWPGNVRELRNAIERAVALTRYDRIAVEDLPQRVRETPPGDAATVGLEGELESLEELERRHIMQVMDALGDNRTLAAQILGIDRKTLYRKLKQYGEG